MAEQTEQDALAMAAVIAGALTVKVAEALQSMDFLTQPTKLEAVDPLGIVKFRLASGLLVTVRVEVADG